MAVEGRVVVVKVKVGAHSTDRVSGPCNSWFHLKKKKYLPWDIYFCFLKVFKKSI